jgi:acetyl-CoA C-acetyltransferase
VRDRKVEEVVIISAVRTAIGKFGGSLSGVDVQDLGAVVIKESLKRGGIHPEDVDEVIMGCVLQAAQGMNVARQAALLADLPVDVPALTLNNVCGSGLKSVNLAAAMIRSGDARVVVAGGMENMSRSPYALGKARFGYRMNNGELIDTMVHDALWDAFNDYHMGVTAENVAEKYGITRCMQDAFSVESQQKCGLALKSSKFAEEIVEVMVKGKKCPTVFAVDESPRPEVTVESLLTLGPAFKDGGTVTPGNATGINDGAAAVVLMSGTKAKQLGLRPLARFVTGASAGVQPEVMGIGPVFSSRKAMKQAGLTSDRLDLVEVNEAFAAQALAVIRELDIDQEKVNVNGGAIALGHPVGASGVRILVTLIHEMSRRMARYGLATLCVGGGMGVSTIIEAA